MEMDVRPSSSPVPIVVPIHIPIVVLEWAMGRWIGTEAVTKTGMKDDDQHEASSSVRRVPSSRQNRLNSPWEVAMNAELRATVCRLVAGLVVSDDDLSPEEDAFIDRILQRFEVADRSEIFPIVDRSEAAACVRVLPAAVRDEALALLIEAAVADGKVVDEERSYLHTVGDAMGVSAAAVDARVQKALAAR
jgi:uncharacterized tellurite resistance protein B-like protein